MAPDLVANLVRAIELKDASTAAHTWRVVLYTRALLEDRRADQAQLEAATHAAALHDIGKLDIPDHILQKPGRLTPDEFEVIKQHTVTGFARMVDLDVDDPIVLDLIRFHHERWDGSGYPYGLRGNDIPEIARDFAVIDTFDALTSHRPYRHHVGQDAAERALAIIEAGSGTHFWPQSARRFIELYRRGSLAYIRDHFNDADPTPAYSPSPPPAA